MKTFIKLFFSIAVFTVLAACNHQSEKNTRLISSTYKEQVFINDRRIENIQSIIPDLQELIEEHAKNNHIPGIAYGIVVDDSLIISGSTGLANIKEKLAVTHQIHFRIASMSKSFSAMAILQLRDKGYLQLSDPAEKYIPELARLEYLTNDSPVISIKNLLTMTSGLPEDNPWGDRQMDESEQMLSDLIAEGLSLSNPASYSYEYSNTGFAMLGRIISVVSGMPYQEYIRKNILQPLGMCNTYWEYDSIPAEEMATGYRWEDEQWKTEPILHDGSFGAIGGLMTTIEDFGKYVSFHLSAWPPRSEADEGPVSRSTLREMHSPLFPRLNTNDTGFHGEACPSFTGYGYGLRISENCNKLKKIGHGGALPGYGSNYVFYPEYGLGIMAFCNLTYTSPYPLKKIEALLFENIELQTRELPVSDILMTRQEQIIKMIQTWDSSLEERILAENFYLDKSREHRMTEIRALLEKAGTIGELIDKKALNQLRGKFIYKTDKGTLDIFFSLSPEHDPRVQYLKLSFKPE